MFQYLTLRLAGDVVAPAHPRRHPLAAAVVVVVAVAVALNIKNIKNIKIEKFKNGK